jgi:hypothetical protein
MVHADHPRFRDNLTVADFLAESHALVRPAGRTHLFERFLEAKNIKLDVRAELSHFASLLTIISNSDLIASVFSPHAALAYGGEYGFDECLAQADGQRSAQ